MNRSIVFGATIVLASLIAGQAGAISPDYIPYVNGVGDPSGLTSSNPVDLVQTGSIVESFGDYIPYVNGVGDPSGLTNSAPVDLVQTGSIVEVHGEYIPYVNGVADPNGLTMKYVADPDGLTVTHTDDTETGSIGQRPRVDVRDFCEGEGKILAERLNVGFCHLGAELEATGSVTYRAVPGLTVAPTSNVLPQ